MKRILCFILSFALCLGLCPVGVWAAGDETDRDPDNGDFTMKEDQSYPEPHYVENDCKFDLNGYTYTFTGTNSSAIIVTGTGRLTLMSTDTVIATGAGSNGIEVQSGGSLTITDATTSVQSNNKYALNIASGAQVKLSGGSYSGKGGAIMFDSEKGTKDDYAGILETGYAFFDKDGILLLPADIAGAKHTKLTVGECSGHSGHSWAHASGTEHSWACPYCGAVETGTCSFSFDENGNGSCGSCGSGIAVEVDRDSLKALARHPDETIQPESGSVTVTADGAALTEDTDYTVKYTTRADVGSSNVTVTVAVTGITYGGTFEKGYTFTEDDLTQPVLEWDSQSATVTYTGKPVEKSSLPGVTINIPPYDDLAQYLQYSYRKQGETAYSNELPTNAGTYDVVVSLPEMEGVYAVSSEPITLTINKLNPISTNPAAKTLTYNGTAQELVTAGELKPAAAADGAVILFATSETGDYSTGIPTGINASSNYKVWYKVEETDNCSAVGPQEITVKISRKKITPVVTLSEYSYLYDGGFKEPKVTVKDEDRVTDLSDTEYTVNYVNNRDVGDATVQVRDSDPKKAIMTSTRSMLNSKSPPRHRIHCPLRTGPTPSFTGIRSPWKPLAVRAMATLHGQSFPARRQSIPPADRLR